MKKYWKKILELPENPTEQERKEYVEIFLFLCFLMFGAIVRIIQMIFWELKEWIFNIFKRVVKSGK